MTGPSPTGSRTRTTPRSPTIRRLWDDRWIYLFLLPTALLFSLFTLWPVLASLWYSLLNWNGFDAGGTFIGLTNYVELTHDPLFWNALKNTLLFMVITVPIRVSLALGAALVLNNRRLPFARFFRTALFLPVVTTTAIVGIVMVFIFDPASGPVNLGLLSLHVLQRPINFLGSSSNALFTAMAVFVWKWFGITLIYWLASLQTVPVALYEAARIDGANTWQLFRHITAPLLVPFAVIIVLITALDTLRVFDLILTLTGGGPDFSSEVMEVYIYRWAFASASPRLGYASAAAEFFGLLTMLLALVQIAGLRLAQQARVR